MRSQQESEESKKQNRGPVTDERPPRVPTTGHLGLTALCLSVRHRRGEWRESDMELRGPDVGDTLWVEPLVVG